MERAPSTLSIGVHINFSRGDNADILLILFRFKMMQCKRTFAKRFTHSTQKEIAPFYGNNHKKCTSLAAIARHFEIKLHKIDSLQIFQTGYFFFRKKQISVVFNKTTIMPLVYPARLASII